MIRFPKAGPSYEWKVNEKSMKHNRLSLLFLLVSAALLMTACTGAIGASSWPGITPSGDTVYVAYANSVEAVQIQPGAGNQVWTAPNPANTKVSYYAAPAVTDSLVIVGDYTNVLHALKRSDGTDAWVYSGATGRYIASPLVAGQLVFAPNADDHLYALDLQGALKWKFQTQQGLWAQPASDGNTVYQPSMDHFLYALNAQDGSLLWKVDLGGAGVSSPVLSDGVIYVGTLTNEMIALNATNGQVVWRTKTTDAIWTTPLLDKGTLYFGDLSGTAYSINAQNGNINWQLPLGGGSIIGTAAIAGTNVIFTAENGIVQAISLSGQKQWNTPINGKLYSNPAVVNNRIIIGIVQGKSLIAALDFNGSEAWIYPPAQSK